MRETLEALAAGEMSVATAEAHLAGYATSEAGRFDTARKARSGVPEAILAEGKTPAETAILAETAIETTGRAIITKIDGTAAVAVREYIDREHPKANIDHHERARVLCAYATDHEPPSLNVTVAVVSAGTADAPVAGEAAVIAGEMGATVERVSDVGVAGIHRLFDRLDAIRAADVVVVAAGREGALPTVIAGLTTTPVIGVPVSTGYGHGGDGVGAFAGLCQSCTVLSVVNIDAGFTAGAQAGLIARAIAAAE